MGDQPELNLFASRAGRDEGMARSAETAGEVWAADARDLLERLAHSQEYVIGDDMWAHGLQAPNGSNTALGQVFRWGARQGLIAKSDRIGTTAQRSGHCRPITVWKSLVYEGVG